MSWTTRTSIALVFITSAAFAQSNPRYVRFPGVPASVKGAFYLPDAPLPAPHVGILVMHRTSNFMSALACTELSRRGFAVLCMNPRSDNNEALVRFETIPLDVRAGVQFLKKQPGITRIILWGWSGGGATMTLYQSVAENGRVGVPGTGQARAVRQRACRTGSGRRPDSRRCPSRQPRQRPEEPQPGCHGRERAPIDWIRSSTHSAPRTATTRTGSSSYSEEFKKRYFKAQADRMNRLIKSGAGQADANEERRRTCTRRRCVRGAARSRWPVDAARSERSPRHSQAAEAAQERRNDRDADCRKRPSRSSAARFRERHLRERHAVS